MTPVDTWTGHNGYIYGEIHACFLDNEVCWRVRDGMTMTRDGYRWARKSGKLAKYLERSLN